MLKQKNIRSVSTSKSSLHADLINRRISFRFAGRNLKLDLSLGLFSSAGVDSGSMCLLKSIARECDLENMKQVLDIGCGTGTLGLAIASRCSDAAVRLIDRDRLAVDITRHNAELNSLRNVETAQRLMLEGPHSSNYNLIVSNFPAKAGKPVLADFLHHAAGYLTPDGRVALVIIKALGNSCRELILSGGNTILYEDSSKQHTVFHFRGAGHSSLKQSREERLAPYLRDTVTFVFKRIQYTLQTVWNIGDFDTHSWRITLLAELLEKKSYRGTIVFWSPGQGHFPLLCLRRRGTKPARLILAGRDRLALLISAKNLENYTSPREVEIAQLAEPNSLRTYLEVNSVDFLLTDLNPIPYSDWSTRLLEMASATIKPHGEWAIVGRSTDLARLLKNTKGWIIIEDKRHRGWRATILQAH